ncbi:hypothetical protein V8E36_006168 [Tilletia maclaganii]
MASNAVFTFTDFYGLAITASFFGCLVPTSLAYALFSTKRMRRLPIFWVQAIALGLAFIYTIVQLAFFRNFTPHRSEYWFNTGQASAALRLLVPLISDVAIVLKVAAFYPAHVGPSQKRLLIIGFPSALLIGRLITQIVTWVAYSNRTVTYLTAALTAEITLQVVGNSFFSILLLRKTFDLARNKHLTTRRAQRRLAHLIEALLMTFIPAIIVQIALMVAQFIDVASTNAGRFGVSFPPTGFENRIYRTETYCQQANVIVSVLFGLLATLWSSIRTRSEDLGGSGSGMGMQESRKSASEAAFAMGSGGNHGTGAGAGVGANAGAAAGASGAAFNPSTPNKATFGTSSRPSARTFSTLNRDEDRPLLSYLVDAHNPIDLGPGPGERREAITSALASDEYDAHHTGPNHRLSGGGGLSSRHGFGGGHRATDSNSNLSWIRMQTKSDGTMGGAGAFGADSAAAEHGNGGVEFRGTGADLEGASTLEADSVRDHRLYSKKDDD